MNQPSPELFLRACDTIAPLQFEIEHAERGGLERRTLPLPFALVGRDERADVRLKSNRVSHRHAYLQVVAGHLWYVDLKSRTGTFGEDGRLGPAPLGLGQRLRIGPYFLRLAGGCRATAADENPLSSASSEPSARPQWGLDFLEGAVERPSWLIDRTLTLVGRGDHCKVRLHSPAVSRTHCALLHTPDGLWAIDLLGRDGIWVNGVSVRWALLADADELRIGQFLIRVRRLDRSAHETRNGSSLTTQERPPSRLEDIFNPARQLAPIPSAIVPTSDGEGPGSLLPPLITQFGLMQQQMFEQFQQALLTMAQMFGDLHHDQLQLVQEEMAQLHELTRELQGLQKELARQTPSPTAASQADKPRTLASPQASAPAVPSDQRKMGPAPATPAPPAPARHGVAAKTSPVAPGASTAPPSESPIRSDTEVHAWLNGRLALLQQERQSRWQKILQAVTGG